MKTISLAVNVDTNVITWERLGGDAKKRKCVTLMIEALENAGFLLPEVTHENHEVTVASPNIRKQLSKVFLNFATTTQNSFISQKNVRNFSFL